MDGREGVEQGEKVNKKGFSEVTFELKSNTESVMNVLQGKLQNEETASS